MQRMQRMADAADAGAATAAIRAAGSASACWSPGRCRSRWPAAALQQLRPVPQDNHAVCSWWAWPGHGSGRSHGKRAAAPPCGNVGSAGPATAASMQAARGGVGHARGGHGHGRGKDAPAQFASAARCGGRVAARRRGVPGQSAPPASEQHRAGGSRPRWRPRNTQPCVVDWPLARYRRPAVSAPQGPGALAAARPGWPDSMANASWWPWRPKRPAAAKLRLRGSFSAGGGESSPWPGRGRRCRRYMRASTPTTSGWFGRSASSGARVS